MSIQYTADQLQRKFPGSAGFARLAEGLRTEGRLDEAIQVCQDGLKARPLQLSGYLILGKVYIDAGRLEEAREQFESALRLDPRCLSAMHFLAEIMNKLQWEEAAAGYYRSILEVEPWDEEIRALLGQPPLKAGSHAAQTQSIASPYEAAAPQDFTPVDPNEDTFHKPEGLSGDVMEINLNDGTDFPAGEDAGTTAATLGDDDLSLEDALAMQAAPEEILEKAPADSGLSGEEPAPISGQDVEDRLDSLFGADDAMPPQPAASTQSDDLGQATASGPLPFLGDATTIQTGFGDADMVTDEERVSGEDIEKRLDDLFSLTEADKLPASRPEASEDFASTGMANLRAAAPVEESRFIDSGTRESSIDDLTRAGETTGVERAGFSDLDEAGSMGTEIGPTETAPAMPEVPEEMVTGQDVAEQLDYLFGAEPAAEESQAPEAAQAEKPSAADFAWSPAEPASASDETGEMKSAVASEPLSGDIMSTESMLPMGWLADAGEQPRITGADIEAQLDKLFDMEGESDRFDAAKVVPGNPQVPVTFADLDPNQPMDAAPEAKSQAMPGDESDLTVTMPVMKDSDLKESVSDWIAKQSDREANTDASGEMRLPVDGDNLFLASDATLELPAARIDNGLVEESELFGGLGLEDMGALSETTSIEMIDGNDVAVRLDELFAPEVSGIETMGMEMPAVETEDPADSALETSDSEAMVTGEEVASRLSEIFEAPSHAVTAPGTTGVGNGSIDDSMEVPFSLETGLETAEAAAPTPVAAQPMPAPQAPNPLAPMMDEEDGYPEEEEMPPQNGVGANVATVTLAEIYFQQGLKEQALQIYRQLLEREPGNDSVRKRISEIEASKSEGENGNPDGQKPDSDPRRPRPGLKVPKRKK